MLLWALWIDFVTVIKTMWCTGTPTKIRFYSVFNIIIWLHDSKCIVGRLSFWSITSSHFMRCGLINYESCPYHSTYFNLFLFYLGFCLRIFYFSFFLYILLLLHISLLTSYGNAGELTLLAARRESC